MGMAVFWPSEDTSGPRLGFTGSTTSLRVVIRTDQTAISGFVESLPDFSAHAKRLASRAAHALMVAASFFMLAPPEAEARHGWADAPRRPCYRGTRTR